MKVEKSVLPEDMDRPFTLDGIKFLPVSSGRLVGPPKLRIRNRNLIAFNKSAAEEFGLASYCSARLVLSEDGKTIGVKFYRENRKGATKVSVHKHDVTVSSRPFIRKVEKLIKQDAPLERTDWDGFFIARFGGEGK